jgi:hypothetical protein
MRSCGLPVRSYLLLHLTSLTEQRLKRHKSHSFIRGNQISGRMPQKVLSWAGNFENKMAEFTIKERRQYARTTKDEMGE